jgi:hypothetical protein
LVQPYGCCWIDDLTSGQKSDSTSSEAPVIGVNYSDVQATTKALEEHNVGTIISTLPLLQSNDHELNLIKAAEASRTTKRFIQSSWGIPYTEESDIRRPVHKTIYADHAAMK